MRENWTCPVSNIAKASAGSFAGLVFFHSYFNLNPAVDHTHLHPVDKEEYLSAGKCSVVKYLEIKALLKQALNDQIDDCAMYTKGINVSYFYEYCSEFKTEEL